MNGPTGFTASGPSAISLNYKEQMEKIAANGNRPEDWKEYIDLIKERIDLLDESRKNKTLAYLYYNAFKVIPESCKSLSRAQLLVDYAEFKGQQDEGDAEKLLSLGRRTLRHHSVVHIACAEFEVKRGNTEKAIKILKQARSIGSVPMVDINVALERIKEGKMKLTDSASKRNLGATWQSPDSGRESSGECSSLQLSGYFEGSRECLQQALPGCKSNTQEVQQGLDYITQCVQAEGSDLSAQPAAASHQHVGLPQTPISRQPPDPPHLLSSHYKDLSFLCWRTRNPSSMHPTSSSSSALASTPAPALPASSLGFLSSSTPSSAWAPGQTAGPSSHLSRPERSALSSENGQPVGESGTAKRSLHHFHSIPDMRSKAASAVKEPARKPIGRGIPPRRVPKTLHEEKESNDDKVGEITVSAFERLDLPPKSATIDCSGLKSENTERENSKLLSGHGEQIVNSSRTNEPFAAFAADPTASMNTHSTVRQPPSTNLYDAHRVVNPCAKDSSDSSSKASELNERDKIPSTHISASSSTEKCPLSRDRNKTGNKENFVAMNTDRNMDIVNENRILSPLKQNRVEPPVLAPKLPDEILPSGDGQAKINNATYTAQQAPVQTPAKSCEQMAQKTKQVNGKCYPVMRLAGRGGSAKVFQVLDMENCMIRALKVVDLSGDNRLILEGYMNEIGLLQKLNGCDRVIKLFDWEYSESSKKLMMVLEFGETDLAKFIAQNAKNTDELHSITICYFWGQMVKAVHAMHKEGVIHSDLKPANFILVSGAVKLIDFGIAKALQVDKTSVLKENMVGTPSYMSPEALIASSADPAGNKPRYKVGVRSDVWSLGCILYQMVYGRTPFQHLRHKLDAIVNPSHTIAFPGVDDQALMDILKKCLTRDVRLRPTTDELLVHPYLKKEPRGN
ncbi:dual specificity protein kinase Ttk [Aplysia californica]|uniref:Dual specificity protein kinase Ttk n=1 Tax=Aplysia californica TaxID=6500 RepID=A0ABM0K3L0_APLCA|nr:dual specificity protein kinase Ttk [Aplysia californica]